MGGIENVVPADIETVDLVVAADIHDVVGRSQAGSGRLVLTREEEIQSLGRRGIDWNLVIRIGLSSGKD